MTGATIGRVLDDALVRAFLLCRHGRGGRHRRTHRLRGAPNHPMIVMRDAQTRAFKTSMLQDVEALRPLESTHWSARCVKSVSVWSRNAQLRRLVRAHGLVGRVRGLIPVTRQPRRAVRRPATSARLTCEPSSR